MTTAEKLAALKAAHAAEIKTDTDRQKVELKDLQMDALLNSAEPIDQILKALGISGTAGLPIILEAFTTVKATNTTQAALIATLNTQIAELNAQLNP